MKILKGIEETRRWLKRNQKSIGFVPTLGGIHKGHLSLVERSQRENDMTVVSLYLNQTQFNSAEDLGSYPASLLEDLEKLQQSHVDLVFTPDYTTIYPDDYQYRIEEQQLSQILCGKDRPGHFTGVLTVVMKLLNIIKPQKAYFGEKDYQQLLLVKGMVDAFFIDTEIIGAPIIRDEKGLALSSRNRKLDEQGLKKAHFFAHTLKSKTTTNLIKEELLKNNISIDYLEDIKDRRFGAIKINDVRLIDNVEI